MKKLLKIDLMFISILVSDNKALTIPIFPCSTAKYNAVL